MTLIVMMDLMLGETSMRMPCQGVVPQTDNDCREPTQKNRQYHFHLDIQLFPRSLSVPAEKPWHSSWLPYLRVRKGTSRPFESSSCI